MPRHPVLSLLLTFLATLGACTSQPLKPGDRERVLRIDHLQPYGVELPENYHSFEKFERVKWLDGTVMIDYEFRPPKSLDLPFLSSSVEKHPSNSAACQSFSAGNIGLNLADTQVSQQNHLFQYGDKSNFVILMVDDSPIGNYFGMCYQHSVFEVVLGGFYFDDGELWGEMLLPLLKTSEDVQ